MGAKKNKKQSQESTAAPTNAGSGYHLPVLLHETIEALAINPQGIYVDCTFGGGGHSAAILEQLGPNGKLIAFDQDADARQNLPPDERLLFLPHNFRHLQRMLRYHNISAVDGIMADLGVSSHQFDEASRGFSIRFDAELDMRMDQRQGLKASEVLATYSEKQLHKMFELYGEVTNAKTLARKIIETREHQSLDRVENFRAAMADIVKGNPNKYFAQVFQALRIEVNDELEALRELLLQLAPVLKPGGRAAIISFHSLEDRLVKTFFKKGNFEEEDNNPFARHEATMNEWKLINKKPILPSAEEMRLNSRSRSAKLRVAEKLMVV